MDKFQSRVDQCLQVLNRLLDSSRSLSISLAEDTSHTYSDKFSLAEALTNSAISAFLNILDTGFHFKTNDLAQRLANFSREGKSVTIRFEFQEMCAFAREEVEIVEGSRSRRIEDGGERISSCTNLTKKLYFWKNTIIYKMFVFVESDPKNEFCVLLGNCAEPDTNYDKTISKEGNPN
jgi:hypothetical protein